MLENIKSAFRYEISDEESKQIIIVIDRLSKYMEPMDKQKYHRLIRSVHTTLKIIEQREEKCKYC